VAAILTPPDAVSQCMMAVPLLILYEISIYVAKYFGKKSELVIKEEINDTD
jgi:sec-independent protein translocase protein TatC